MKGQQESESQPTLLFIPDISGFTEFVHNTEVSHSKHIVEELLEVLIDANEIGLEISEIEGDAILFYRTGKTPTAAEILAQVQKMYEKFHGHLKKYESLRICQCGACSQANGLELKFIIHYGDIAKKQVKTFSKLFGTDLVVVHRLMKNDIPMDEYVLITHQLIDACASWVEFEQVAWETPSQSTQHYDFGEVKYCYLPLEPLQSLVPEPTIEDYAPSYKMMKTLHVEAAINAPIEMVFDIVSDVASKHLWILGVKGSEQMNSKIARNGSTHKCIMGGGDQDPFFVSHGFDISRDFITWTDTDPRTNTSLVIQLRRIGKGLTRASITTMAKQNFFKKIMYNLFEKKKYARFFGGSLEKLNEYCQDLRREKRRHPSSILLEPAAAA